MTSKIKRIVRKYYEQLYANTWDNLDEMDKFLETYNLPKLNQKESENLRRQIAINEIEAVTKKLPTNKSPGPEGFTGEFYQTFKEKLVLENQDGGVGRHTAPPRTTRTDRESNSKGDQHQENRK